MNGGGFHQGYFFRQSWQPVTPASIARSSVGTGLYAQSESGRSKKDEQFEAILSEHYVALKRYLASSLRDEKGNPSRIEHEINCYGYPQFSSKN